MLKPVFISTASILALALFSSHAKAQLVTEPNNLNREETSHHQKGLTDSFDQKHKACLERIADDNELAYEEAMIWRSEGGGRRAKHCEAMALFSLGHADEAAHRLDKLAAAPDGGSPEMRANFFLEASNFWIAAGNGLKAYASAKAGLDIDKTRTDLRIARARAYAMGERYDYAETDLSHALKFEPNNVPALRYRADARLRQDKLAEALADIELALALDIESVDTALLRGQIKEAIRKSEKLKTEK